jgi:hypothetical protein
MTLIEKSVSALIENFLSIQFENHSYNLNGWGKTDNFVKIKETLILLEIEDKQKHPSTNVLKLWPFLKETPKVDVILIHAYIENCHGLKSNRGRLADWIADELKSQFNKRFDYIKLVVDLEISTITQLSGNREWCKNFNNYLRRE